MLTANQADRLLALPVEWRLRLAMADGAGCRIRKDRPPSLRAHPTPEHVERGWAWAPADRLAWLEATGRNWGTCMVWSSRGTRRDFYFTVGGRFPCPIDAALSYMENHKPLEEG